MAIDFTMLVRGVVSHDECARCTARACFEVMVPWAVFEKHGTGAIAAERVEWNESSWARFVTCLRCHDDLLDGAEPGKPRTLN